MRELFVKSARASLPQFPYTDTDSLALSLSVAVRAEETEDISAAPPDVLL